MLCDVSHVYWYKFFMNHSPGKILYNQSILYHVRHILETSVWLSTDQKNQETCIMSSKDSNRNIDVIQIF